MIQKEVFPNIRARLEHERASLLNDIKSLANENQAQQDDYGIGNHVADDATEVFTRERNLALRNNTQELLTHVEAALRRLEEGSYGLCARCGQEIAPERLEALPYAIYCITCQGQIEHER